MKKYIFIVCVLAVIFIASPAFTQAAALSQPQIDAIVLLLQSFGADQTAISNVQTSLTGGTPNIETASSATSSTTTTTATTATSSNTATTTTAPYYNFTKNLKVGFTGDDVIALQKFLTSKGFLTMPDGVARGYFGYSTKSALVAYQKSIGILSTGYFGLLTRTYINEDQESSSTELTETTATTQTSITVLSPNGGEQWPVGSTQIITWNALNFPTGSTVYIELRPYGDPPFAPIAKIAVTTSLNGSYSWQVPSNIIPGQYIIEIYKADQYGNIDSNESAKDVSNAPFGIVAATTTIQPFITSIYPTSGPVGTKVKVYGNDFSSLNKVAFINTQGVYYYTEWSPTSNTEIEILMPSGMPAGQYYIWLSSPSESAQSTQLFTVTASTTTITTQSSITVLLPNGGESWPIGGTQTITWNALNFPTGSTVYIELRPYGDFSVGSNLAISPVTKIVTTSYVSGSYSWQVPSNIIPGQYIIEIYKADQYGNIDSNESAKDVSNAPFGIVAATTTTTTSACSSVTMNGVSYSLNPCSIAMSMVDGQGNKNFSTTIIPSVANSSYSFYVQGYGEGLPTYGILGGSSGGAIGNTTINLYFNDNIFSADGNQSKIYTGYLIIRIYQSTATGYDNHDLNLGITLTVSPSALGAVSTTQMASSTTSSNTANILDAINKLIESFSK